MVCMFGLRKREEEAMYRVIFISVLTALAGASVMTGCCDCANMQDCFVGPYPSPACTFNEGACSGCVPYTLIEGKFGDCVDKDDPSKPCGDGPGCKQCNNCKHTEYISYAYCFADDESDCGNTPCDYREVPEICTIPPCEFA